MARRRSRALIIVVIVVVVIVVLSVVAVAFLSTPAPPPVQVGEMIIWAPDHVCDLNATPNNYYSGFNASKSSSVSFDIYVPDFNATSCTVHSVFTNTTGFTVQATPLPLVVPAGSNTTILNLTISTPSSSFSGNMNLVFG